MNKISIKEVNPNHHIYLNRGMYWCYVTVRIARGSLRKRFSLRTKDVEEARRRRDFLFRRIGERFVILSK